MKEEKTKRKKKKNKQKRYRKDDVVFLSLFTKRNEHHNTQVKRLRTRKKIKDDEIETYEG